LDFWFRQVFCCLAAKTRPVPLTVEKPEQITGSFARIAGFDNEKQPYEVTAQKGYQDREVANLVHMEDLIGTFRRGSGQSYEVYSKYGPL
jgi:hypothetical protein